MGAPKGNQFWKNRTKHGRNKLFESPDLLWEQACKYFEWCDNNPLFEEVSYHYQGEITTHYKSKMRAYSWSGLSSYLRIASLRDYKKKDGYDHCREVISWIDNIIYTQKFEGAAADLLNANIISRDLGLTEKQDITSEGKGIKQNVIEFAGKKVVI